jgi:hypothetical protein
MNDVYEYVLYDVEYSPAISYVKTFILSKGGDSEVGRL